MYKGVFIMDIYNSSGFQWWCKQRRNSSFVAIAFLAFFLVVFCSGFASSWKTDEMSSASIDNGAVCMLGLMFIVFIVMILNVFRAILRNMRIKVDECWYGTVKDFYVKRYGSTNNRHRRLYIVADVNGKQIDARCMPKTYSKAQQGREVIVFRVKGEKPLYCVHPEM